MATPKEIIELARSYKGKFFDADAPELARQIAEVYPDMAGYAKLIGPNTPWCGVFNAYVHAKLGIRPAYTKNSTDYDDFAWADAPIEGKWGTLITRAQAQPGDTVVLRVPHHITFLDHDNGDGTFAGTGGNQSNAVTTTNFNWGNIRGIVRAPGAGEAAKPPPKSERFEVCIPLVLKHEGGNDDDPRDPGGRTSRGITAGRWAEWRQTHPGLPADVWDAPQSEVLAIYREKYWDVLWCDKLPPGVDYCVFDYGVNSGPGRSARVLQTVVGSDVDGEVGPNTVAATRQHDPATVINEICDERMRFLRGLSTWATFGKGWTNRVNDVRRDALAMVGTFELPDIEEEEPDVEIPPVEDLAARISVIADGLRKRADELEAIHQAMEEKEVATKQPDLGDVLAPLLKELLPKLIPVLLPLLMPGGPLFKLLPTLLPLLLGGGKPLFAVEQPKPAMPAGAWTGIGGVVLGLLSTYATMKGWLPPAEAALGIGAGASAAAVGGTQAAKEVLKK